MKVVNTQRACCICGMPFYPSVSNSLFHCERENCKKEFDATHEEIAKLGEENGKDNRHRENEK